MLIGFLIKSLNSFYYNSEKPTHTGMVIQIPR